MRIIAGKYRNKFVHEPHNEKTRPTASKTREAIFNIIDNYGIKKDKIFVDLFAGSGVVGFEALSREFKKVIWIEIDKKNLAQIHRTIDEFKLPEPDYEIYNTDALIALKKLAKRKDELGIIFVDPPYKLGLIQKTIDLMIKLGILSTLPVMIEKSVEEKLELPEGLDMKKYDYGDTELIVII